MKFSSMEIRAWIEFKYVLGYASDEQPNNDAVTNCSKNYESFSSLVN